MKSINHLNQAKILPISKNAAYIHIYRKICQTYGESSKTLKTEQVTVTLKVMAALMKKKVE